MKLGLKEAQRSSDVQRCSAQQESLGLIILLLVMIPVAATFDSNGKLTEPSHESVNQLKDYIAEHTNQNNLQMLGQEIVGVEQQNKTYFYLFSSVQFVQLCFQGNNSDNYLPNLIKLRNYQPIRSKTGTSQVRCYQIFNKLQLLQQPSLSRITQEKGKKYGREIEYQHNEHQLAGWLHNLWQQIQRSLSKIPSEARTELNGLTPFSLQFSKYSDGRIKLLRIWKEKKQNKQEYSIVKNLQGKGLHRKVIYKIHLNRNKNSIENDINSEECQVKIVETVPHSTYVDTDELKSRGVRVGLGDSISFINIQKPAYQSRQYQYELTIPWADWSLINIDQYQIELPFHFRYPAPFHLTEEKNLEYIQQDLNPLTRAQIICTFLQGEKTFQLKEDYLVGRGTALIPVGDGLMKSTAAKLCVLFFQQDRCVNERKFTSSQKSYISFKIRIR